MRRIGLILLAILAALVIGTFIAIPILGPVHAPDWTLWRSQSVPVIVRCVALHPESLKLARVRMSFLLLHDRIDTVSQLLAVVTDSEDPRMRVTAMLLLDVNATQFTFDGSTGVWAARWLMDIDEKAVERALMPALSDPNKEVRLEAMGILSQFGTPEINGALVAQLADEDADIRAGAAAALARSYQSRERITSEALSGKGLSGDDYWKQIRAAQDFAPVEPLAALLADHDGNVRMHAAIALATLQDPRGEAELIGALTHENDFFRAKATWALARVGRATVDDVLSLLDDASSGVRKEAITAVHRFRDPRIVEHAIALMKDEDSTTRYFATQALVQSQDPRAVQPLMDAMRNMASDGIEHRDLRSKLEKFPLSDAQRQQLATLRPEQPAL
jgi:HEAT repeat protein